jgi:fatty-acyl-CoA synthase
MQEGDIIAWAKEHMAAYKYPRTVELAEALPRNASGKVMWRTLQAQQDAKDACAQADMQSANSKA